MKDITRRGFIGLGASAIMTIALAGCSSGSGSKSASSASSSSAQASSSTVAPPSSTGAKLQLATGSDKGTYFEFGTILAKHANANGGLDITVISSDGSKSNIFDLDDGIAQLAFCQSDVMTYAYTGAKMDFEGSPVTCFSTVAELYEEQVQIVTCNPDIKSVADLKGKSVSIGAVESGTYFNAIDVLGAYGITVGDIMPQYQNFKSSADALMSGEIDAAFLVAGAPTAAIQELSEKKSAYLVEVDSEHIQKLVSASPYYSEAKIPAKTYAMQDKEVTTLSVAAILLARDDCAEGDVYAFVKDIFDNLDEFVAQNPKFKEFALEKGASVTTVPYHPGAARYFTEKGLAVKAK